MISIFNVPSKYRYGKFLEGRLSIDHLSHCFLILSDSEDGLLSIKDIANPDFMFLAWIQYLVCHVSFLYLGF